MLRREVAGAVIAGGASRRMGRPKGLLDLGDGPLVLRTFRLLAERCRKVVVCGEAGGVYAGLGLPVIPDRVPGCGPMSGLLTALHWSPCSRVAVLPCDMPDLTPAVLDALLAGGEDADVVVARSPRGPEPLLAVYRRRCLPAVEAAVARGDYRMMCLLDGLAVDAVDMTAILGDRAAAVLRNVNTPGDLPPAPPGDGPDVGSPQDGS